MKNLSRRLAVALVLIAPLMLAGCGINDIPRKKQIASQKFADVQAAYQRRADLIPSLVATVKGYAAQEKSVLIGVTEARASATQVRVDPNTIANNPAAFKQFEQSQATLGGALSRLLVVQERYPELRSNEQFLQLQSQLEGTENRILIARRDFNEAATDYNTSLVVLPTSIWHSVMYQSYQPMPLFSATPAAQNAPTVNFDQTPAPAASGAPAAK
jgi:LemA protein